MEILKKYKNYIITILLIIGIVSTILYIRHLKNELREETNLVESLSHDIIVWKDKDSLSHAKIQVIETQNVKDFLKIKSSDSIILDLQKTVKQYKKKLKEKGSVTNFTTETLYDTIYTTKDTLVDKNFRYSDTIHNNYIFSVFGIKDGLTHYSLKVKNSYSVIIGQESQGWFKRPKPFVEIINKNPYSETKSLRTYEVALPRIKKFVVGPGVNIGIDGKVTPGVNLTYGIIRF